MHLDWSETTDVTINKLTETLPADALDRAKYAEYLTRFLVGKGQITNEKPDGGHYVLNLNAEWGAGKSYFLKRWAEDLKTEHPVIYIDAWQQDYSDDPLLTAVSAMINQLRVQAGKDADKTIFKAPRKMLGLLKAAAPAAIAGIVKRYAGVDVQEVMQAADDDALGTVTDEHTGKEIDLSKAASAMVKSLLDDHDAKAQAILALKEQVKQWVGAVIGKHTNSGHQKDYPAFILVDELDRCRPSYAVEMLETIKHIFDIPGVVFVVATDTEQLQHTVKALYGEGFDARAYLGRFFNSRYTLKTPSLEKLLPVHCEVHKLSQQYLEGKGIISWPDLDYPPEANGLPEKGNLKNLIAVFDAFELNARLALQLTERLISCVESLQKNVRINLVYLAFMMCEEDKYPEEYPKISKFYADDSPLRKTNLNISIDTRNIYADVIDYQLQKFKRGSFMGGMTTLSISPEIFASIANKSLQSELPTQSNKRSDLISQIGNRRSSSQDFIPQLISIWVLDNNNFANSNNFYTDLVELSCSLDSGDA